MSHPLRLTVPEDDQRCIRNGGHNWRCKKVRKLGEVLCDHHFAQKMAKKRRSRCSSGAISQQQPSHSTVAGPRKVDKQILSANEKVVNNSPVVDPVKSNRELYREKEVSNGESNGPSIKEKDKSNPNFLMETTHNGIPSEDAPDPLTLKLEHTTTSLQKTGNMISKGVSGAADNSVMKYNEQDTSFLIDSFSISACMEELKKYHYIPMMKRLKAIKELQRKNWRETFLCMDEEMRKAWLESFE